MSSTSSNVKIDTFTKDILDLIKTVDDSINNLHDIKYGFLGDISNRVKAKIKSTIAQELQNENGIKTRLNPIINDNLFATKADNKKISWDYIESNMRSKLEDGFMGLNKENANKVIKQIFPQTIREQTNKLLERFKELSLTDRLAGFEKFKRIYEEYARKAKADKKIEYNYNLILRHLYDTISQLKKKIEQEKKPEEILNKKIEEVQNTNEKKIPEEPIVNNKTEETTKPEEILNKKIEEEQTTNQKIVNKKIEEEQTTNQKIVNKKIEEEQTTNQKIVNKKIEEVQNTNEKKILKEKIEELESTINKQNVAIQEMTDIIKSINNKNNELKQNNARRIEEISKMREEINSLKEGFFTKLWKQIKSFFGIKDSKEKNTNSKYISTNQTKEKNSIDQSNVINLNIIQEENLYNTINPTPNLLNAEHKNSNRELI